MLGACRVKKYLLSLPPPPAPTFCGVFDSISQGNDMESTDCYYRPQMKLREGNVFTPICQSFCSQGGLPNPPSPVGRPGGVGQTPPDADADPPSRPLPPPGQTPLRQIMRGVLGRPPCMQTPLLGRPPGCRPPLGKPSPQDADPPQDTSSY